MNEHMQRAAEARQKKIGNLKKQISANLAKIKKLSFINQQLEETILELSMPVRTLTEQERNQQSERDKEAFRSKLETQKTQSFQNLINSSQDTETSSLY